uniref:HD domain-containing protein 2 n=1 Tax=Doryrhamphus excisus TaxID=161450 RepID=UPI0025AE1EE0|nr:HD domain-containing protein 2 [Doryrhamphus excisus]
MAAPLDGPGGMQMLQFLKLIGQLKRVPRTGWVYRKVKDPESVSDHMYRMALMALTITDPTVDKDRCMKMALVHDLAECIVGDITPLDNVGKAEKHRQEEAAMRQLTSLTPGRVGQEMYGLWEEYENQSSPEARLVKEFDRLEMILQAHEYEEMEGAPGRLQEFFDSTEGRFRHPDVLQLVSSLNDERRGHMTRAAKNSGESQPDPTAHTL